MSKKSDSPVPQHVAIIMDGNGRWAQQRGLSRLKGHEEGAQSVAAIMRACKQQGVKYLTLYAFSTENWQRPITEINGLMRLLKNFLQNHEPDLHREQTRLRVIGRLNDLPLLLRRELKRIMNATQTYDCRHLILALSYGGRDEITRAARALAREAEEGRMAWKNIDEKSLADRLFAPDVPDPDLLIRTSGEKRLSNFLLWQASYAELYFTETLWPDFREPAFKLALEEYARRGRRFGRVK